MSRFHVRRLLKRFLVCLLVFFQSPAHALGKIAIRTVDMSPFVFKGMVDARPGVQRLSDFLEVSSASARDLKRLEDLLTRAQRAYLNQAPDDARRGFLRVVELLHAADWPNEERKALHYSLLRLAQLNGDAALRRERLLEAANFAPDLSPDPKLFPPPLITEYQSQLQVMEKSAYWLDPQEFLSGYEAVRLNGRIHRLDDFGKILVPGGLQRITILSDAYHAETALLTGVQLKLYQPRRIPLVEGSCASLQPVLSTTLAAHSLIAVFSEDCARERIAGNWKKTWQAPQLQELLPPQLQQRLAMPEENESIRLPESPESEQPYYKRSWFWGTVGVVVATSAYLLLKNKESDDGSKVRPVEHSGF